MRVVLRHPETGLFLHTSGEWFPERATAREFESAVVAYWWAVERRLCAEVWLALKDPSKDFACMRVQPVVGRPVIDCQHDHWIKALHSLLFNSIEVDLINYHCAEHGQSCDLMAQAFATEFKLHRDTQARTAQFRKTIQPRSPIDLRRLV